MSVFVQANKFYRLFIKKYTQVCRAELSSRVIARDKFRIPEESFVCWVLGRAQTLRERERESHMVGNIIARFTVAVVLNDDENLTDAFNIFCFCVFFFSLPTCRIGLAAQSIAP